MTSSEVSPLSLLHVEGTMKIIRLEAKNVKRLRAVQIAPDPDGQLVIVGGDNGQGKTSVLDSIAYALLGKEALPREPLRRGEESGSVVVDLGDFVVRRTFGKDGATSLVIDTKDGGRLLQPQTRLDDLIGRLSFDPLEFSRMKAKEQAETLRELVGLDFSELVERRAAIFAERTDANRQAKGLEARLAAMPIHEAPEKEISTEALVADLEAAEKTNARHAARRRAIDEAKGEETAIRKSIAAAKQAVAITMEEIERLQSRLALQEKGIASQEEVLAAVVAERETQEAEVAALQDVDYAPLRAAVLSAEETNRKVRENRTRARLAEDVDTWKTASASLTSQIESIDEIRRAAIANAKFPVEGLGFDAEGGVTFQGIPFEQASAAEQLRVSAAMGLAMNPKLRILLIRDGSLLDGASLRILADMAAEHDAQVWVERVEKDGATVIIEDGMVVEVPAVAEA
jgi:hypothetical protein